MTRIFRISVIAIFALALYAGAAWGVKAVDGKGGYSHHSYQQQKPQKQEVQVVLPEIIHTPPLQISSTSDFLISAQITNLEKTGGIPIIYYRFDGEKDYYKRAFHRVPSGRFEFKILSAALTGKKIEYYIEVATGSKVLASLGDEKVPIEVAIVGPVHNKVFLWAAIVAIVAAIVVKLVMSTTIKSYKEKTKEKTKTVAAVNKPGQRQRKHPQLSARSR